MADSEISRTLPGINPGKDASKETSTENLPRVIDRRNLLSVAARILSFRIAETNGVPRASGPTPVREMWPRWYAFHQQCVQATRHRQKLENKMLDVAGSLPIVEIDIAGSDQPTVVGSLADINRLTSNLDAEQLHRVRAELHQRRKRWRRADQRLGYSTAVVREQELADRTGIMGRVMWITKPSTLIEVTAKLHCLIVMNDPTLRRVILNEFTHWT
ncbi:MULTISPECIES: hypothetical protein [unclassified Phyllobacterium]|uniref:hypothetical protein n=1 Tax=unclassified Phyllobacterium TaxID=2638441 RepID=UPI003012F5E5